MIQSMVNIQFEQLKKMFKEIPFSLNVAVLSLMPKELACLGIRVTDADIAFAKSRIMLSLFHQ